MEVVASGTHDNTNVQKRADAGLCEVLLVVAGLDVGDRVTDGGGREHPAEQLGDRPLEELQANGARINRGGTRERKRGRIAHEHNEWER